jgi:hypothetical protein
MRHVVFCGGRNGGAMHFIGNFCEGNPCRLHQAMTDVTTVFGHFLKRETGEMDQRTPQAIVNGLDLFDIAQH